jgi:hypothetical protein
LVWKYAIWQPWWDHLRLRLCNRIPSGKTVVAKKCQSFMSRIWVYEEQKVDLVIYIFHKSQFDRCLGR